MSSDNEPCDSREVFGALENPSPNIEGDFGPEDPTNPNYEVEYLMNIRLNETLGSDLPLFDYRLNVTMDDDRLWKFRHVKGNRPFDDRKEDYWLFSFHVNAADMFFLIGGENAAFAKSVPNWHDAFTVDKTRIEQRDDAYSSWVDFDLEKERLVAVRAPKATNPAITVWGEGNYAALHWVGLFVKSPNDSTNEFIAVRTSKKLLPKYDDRGTVLKMQGTDVTGRSITLFPKQLFGTKGSNRATFDKFVTDDPNNKLGRSHRDSIPLAKMIQNRYPTYTWNASGTTLIKSYANYIGPGFPRPNKWATLDYARGTFEATTTQGLEMLIRLFGSVSKAVLGIIRGDFMEVVSALLEIPGDIVNEKNPDANGLITVVVEIGKAVWDKAHEINIDDVKVLAAKNSLIDKDFGSG